jgi:tetratricopeptide (TPR) repeat protein
LLVTRLELFLRRCDVAPCALAKKTMHSRQHLLRLRMGESLPPRRCILLVTAACEVLTETTVAPETLFEAAGGMLASGGKRLSEMLASDFRRLDDAIGIENAIRERVQVSGVASESAAVFLLRAGRQRIAEQPDAAAEIFGVAEAMTSSLTSSAPELVAALSAEAYKGRAGAMERLGLMDDALADLAAASAQFAEAQYCPGEAAEAEHSRARMLFGRGRSDEGVAAARAARGHFLSARNARGAAHAEIAEACMRLEQGDTEGARLLFHQLRQTLWKLRDANALTQVWLQLAQCEAQRGDEANARRWLRRAMAGVIA